MNRLGLVVALNLLSRGIGYERTLEDQGQLGHRRIEGYSSDLAKYTITAQSAQVIAQPGPSARRTRALESFAVISHVFPRSRRTEVNPLSRQ